MPGATEKTAAERITNRMRRDILSGKLDPGAKLRFEYLRDTYEVGMSTLRESLTKLTSEGLVVAEGQRGFHVAPVSLAELWDVTRVRQQLECAALRRSIEIGDDRWESGIVAAFHLLSKLQDPNTGLVALLSEDALARHRDFHFALIASCDSPWSLRFVSTLYDSSERYRRFSTLHARTPRDTTREHEELMNAALQRNAELAARLLHAHLERTAEVVTSIFSSWART